MERGGNVEGMWREYGWNMKDNRGNMDCHGGNMERKRMGYGRNMEAIRRKYGGNAEEIRRKEYGACSV